MLTATLIAFATVFVAELGDKTQLIALGFGARHRLWVVAVGLTIGYGLSNLLAAAVGGAVGQALPTSWVGVASGVVGVSPLISGHHRNGSEDHVGYGSGPQAP